MDWTGWFLGNLSNVVMKFAPLFLFLWFISRTGNVGKAISGFLLNGLKKFLLTLNRHVIWPAAKLLAAYTIWGLRMLWAYATTWAVPAFRAWRGKQPLPAHPPLLPLPKWQKPKAKEKKGH